MYEILKLLNQIFVRVLIHEIFDVRFKFCLYSKILALSNVLLVRLRPLVSG